MISSDSHLIEPPDLWTERVDADFRERAPRVVREQGGDWWYIDGKRSMSFLGVQTGDRFEKDATELITEARFEQVRPAALEPARDDGDVAPHGGSTLDAERQQAMEQWLRRIPDDPGGLLRRKFALQHRRRGADGTGTAAAW